MCLGNLARQAVSKIILNKLKGLSSNIPKSNPPLVLFETDNNIAKLEHIPNLYAAWALKRDYGCPIVVVMYLIHPSERNLYRYGKDSVADAYNFAFELAKEYAKLRTNNINILEKRLLERSFVVMPN